MKKKETIAMAYYNKRRKRKQRRRRRRRESCCRYRIQTILLRARNSSTAAMYTMYLKRFSSLFFFACLFPYSFVCTCVLHLYGIPARYANDMLKPIYQFELNYKSVYSEFIQYNMQYTYIYM